MALKKINPAVRAKIREKLRYEALARNLGFLPEDQTYLVTQDSVDAFVRWWEESLDGMPKKPDGAVTAVGRWLYTGQAGLPRLGVREICSQKIFDEKFRMKVAKLGWFVNAQDSVGKRVFISQPEYLNVPSKVGIDANH